MPPLITACRPLHWLKNLLVFVAILVSHRFLELHSWWLSLLGFIALSCTASAGYLFNDLTDLQADRTHPVKQHRPMASGRITAVQAGTTAAALLALSVFLGITLGAEFLLGLALYFLTTTTYSLWLKKMVIIDVLVLGLLFTLRIIIGCAALTVDPSFWLLAFSLFFFLSIALVKRFIELDSAGNGENGHCLPRRGYMKDDRAAIGAMGVASGYLSVLVLALYVNSDQVLTLYSHPHDFWGLCLLVLYWISRLWFLAHRNELCEDPVFFAARDGVSWLVAGAGLCILLLAL